MLACSSKQMLSKARGDNSRSRYRYGGFGEETERRDTQNEKRRGRKSLSRPAVFTTRNMQEATKQRGNEVALDHNCIAAAAAWSVCLLQNQKRTYYVVVHVRYRFID